MLQLNSTISDMLCR